MLVRSFILIVIVLGVYAQSGSEKQSNFVSDTLKIWSREATPINIEEIRAKIKYPKGINLESKEDKVILQILVDEEGNYVKHIVISSPHPSYTKAVEKYVRRLKFKPAITFGEPVKDEVIVAFDIRK